MDHLTKKPQNGERCLKEILSILVENDISPFEVKERIGIKNGHNIVNGCLIDCGKACRNPGRRAETPEC